MLQAWLLAAAVMLQDPKPAAKTVEDRIQELDQKLAALEKKHQALTEDNAAMEKKVADNKAQWESWARVAADMWAKSYGKAAELSETQVADLRETWYGWFKEDDENKPKDGTRWKAREAALKSKLSAEQVALLVRKIREEQEEKVKMAVAAYVHVAQIAPERAAPFRKIVLARITIPEDVLIPNAHANPTWERTLPAIRESLPELENVLTEEERTRLRDALEGTQIKGK